MSRTISSSHRQQLVKPRLIRQARFLAGAAILLAACGGGLVLWPRDHPATVHPAPSNANAYAYLPGLLRQARKTDGSWKLPHHNWFVVTQGGHHTLVVLPRTAPGAQKRGR